MTNICCYYNRHLLILDVSHISMDNILSFLYTNLRSINNFNRQYYNKGKVNPNNLKSYFVVRAAISTIIIIDGGSILFDLIYYPFRKILKCCIIHFWRDSFEELGLYIMSFFV